MEVMIIDQNNPFLPILHVSNTNEDALVFE